MGAHADFAGAQDFLADTGMASTTMLWEPSGALWELNGVHINSALQLVSYDLAEKTKSLFFDDKGQNNILQAAPQRPWAPEP